MAEPAGLALGAIALASLFSTCVDLFDVFELAKNYVYDYELACTKIGLLRTRLEGWGMGLNVGAPGHESPVLRRYWVTEKDSIGRSLLGIEHILRNTSVLVEKYKFAPEESCPPNAPRSNQGHPRSHGPASGQHGPSQSSWSRLKKRTSWAIHDKGKFDGFIQDLSFFIENLEVVSDRLQKQSSQASLASTDQPVQTAPQPHATKDAAEHIHPLSTASTMVIRNDSNPRGTVPQVHRSETNLGADHRFEDELREPPKEHYISGTQKNVSAMGIQGILGGTNDRYRITGFQLNSDGACGVQGVATPEALAYLQDRAYARENKSHERN